MNYLLEEGIRPTFGRHEKFVFRQSWLKKGIDAVQKDPAIFNQDEALVILGVGKNMVRSIRHWGLAIGIFEEITGQGRVHHTRVTPLGMNLFNDSGWDPYLEDPATLWLLHWQLVSDSVRSLVWQLTFSVYHEHEFSKRQLVHFIQKQFQISNIQTTPSMIEREVDTCLLTYISPRRRRLDARLLEESIDCPLSELDLLHYSPEDNLYSFRIGPKLSLPPEIFAYALLHYLVRVAKTRHTVAVEECLYEPFSPGQAFKLDENSLVEYFDTLEDLTKGNLRLQETAGLKQLYLQEKPDFLLENYGRNLLRAYYE